ncbi:MAG: NAD(P)H-hydrate dehydratase [Thermoplasmata archaeon]|nr:NAD(P)H-hydrate dehydratase [Thermoplasmata archaeon]
MLSANEVKVLDINSEFFGVPTERLMENAGKAVAEVTLKFNPKKVTVCCGIGNNGGDGFVAARYISKVCDCSIALPVSPSQIKTEIARKNFEKVRNLKIFTYLNEIERELEESDVIVDALLGIGLRGSLKEPYRSLVKLINKSKAKKIAVDVPTGMGTDLAVKADVTVTFHDIKEGMDKETCGEIVVADIGIPKEAEEYVGPGELKVYYPKPKTESHKGENGVLLVVGGGPYIGAPVLAAMAALRTGIDLVYLAVPRRVANAFYSLFREEEEKKWRREILLNLIPVELSKEDYVDAMDINKLEEILDRTDAVIVGCGMGRRQESLEFVRNFLKKCKERDIPVVIDADAIAMVGSDKSMIEGLRAVITPHRGEFLKLTGERLPSDVKEMQDVVKKWAEKLNATIVLKGKEDIITDGKRIKRNKIHNPAMTVGGTGDVLAGIIGALLSKKVDPFIAGCMGVFINGSAGNLAFEKYSYGLLATDLIEEIPNVLRANLNS